MSLDYGIVTAPSGREKRFFVSAGMGYDARVCYKANHTKIKKVLNRMRMGKLVYLVVGLKYLIGAEVFHGSLEVDAIRGRGILLLSKCRSGGWLSGYMCGKGNFQVEDSVYHSSGIDGPAYKVQGCISIPLQRSGNAK